MNWHASLVALTIITGIAVTFSAFYSLVEEDVRPLILVTVPLVIAFVLLVGAVNA